MRRHSPITPSSTDLGTLLSSSTASSKENRHGRFPIQSIHCRIGLDQPLPTLLPRRLQIALTVYNFQSMLTAQRQFNGYVFSVFFYPSGHFELLLQMPVRVEESNLQCHRVSKWCAVNVRCSALQLNGHFPSFRVKKTRSDLVLLQKPAPSLYNAETRRP